MTTLSPSRDAARDPLAITPTIIRPPARWPGFGLAEFWRFRSICIVLAQRSLMVRYRQTVVGAAWAVIQPVTLMLVFTVFFGIMGRFPSQGIPYPVFFLTGLVAWYLISRVVSEGTGSVVANAALVNRVYFPRAYFPASTALTSLLDLGLGLIALCVVLVAFQIVPGPQVVVLPVCVAIGLAAALGVAFWLSALNVAYRDVTQLLPFLVQVWFFCSPIIYPSTIVPEPYRTIYFLNPAAVVIDGFRWAFDGTPPPPEGAWLLGSVVAATLLVSGYLFFRQRESTFSDVV